MFSPRHTGWENCCYNPEAERASAEFEAQYWKKEAEKWKAIAEGKGYKPDEKRLDELEGRMDRVESWVNRLIDKTRLID